MQVGRDEATSSGGTASSGAVGAAWLDGEARGGAVARSSCLDPGVLLLTADGRLVPLARIEAGDVVVGTEYAGRTRRYVATTVLDRWTRTCPAFRLTVADGTSVVAAADHRFLTDRGWKAVVPARPGEVRRAYLTPSNAVRGIGGLPLRPRPESGRDAFASGYLAGLIRAHVSPRASACARRRGLVRPAVLRLAYGDLRALARARDYLAEFGVVTRLRPFGQDGAPCTRAVGCLVCGTSQYGIVRAIVTTPADPGAEWSAGFCSGVLDATGLGGAAVRFGCRTKDMAAEVRASLARLGVRTLPGSGLRPGSGAGPADDVRVVGADRSRLLALLAPATGRDRAVGRAVRSNAGFRVARIEPLGDRRMIGLSTQAGDFVANGFVSHDCAILPAPTVVSMVGAAASTAALTAPGGSTVAPTVASTVAPTVASTVAPIAPVAGPVAAFA